MVIDQLKSLGLDFNHLFILECYYEDNLELLNIFKIPSFEDFTISSACQFLKKEEYIVENPNDEENFIISVKGRKLVEELQSTRSYHDKKYNRTHTVVIASLSPTPEEQFEEWWNMYPTTPKWETDDKATSFIGSRNLKNLTKAKARSNYLKLLNQGLKHEDLLGALKYEIKLKKLDSIKKKENQMEYFKGMESYFNTSRFTLFIDGYKQDPKFVDDIVTKVKSKKQNVTDI